MTESLAVFHLLMLSPLNVGSEKRRLRMLLTAAVFQLPMLLQYVIFAVIRFASQLATAVPMFASVMTVWEVTWEGRSTSNAKRTKAFEVFKTAAPLMAESRILVVGVASSLAILGPGAHGQQPFAFFAVGTARETKRIARR